MFQFLYLMNQTNRMHTAFLPFEGNGFGPNDMYDCGAASCVRSVLFCCVYPYFGATNCAGYCYGKCSGNDEDVKAYSRNLYELCKWSQTTVCCFLTDYPP